MFLADQKILLPDSLIIRNIKNYILQGRMRKNRSPGATAHLVPTNMTSSQQNHSKGPHFGDGSYSNFYRGAGIKSGHATQATNSNSTPLLSYNSEAHISYSSKHSTSPPNMQKILNKSSFEDFAQVRISLDKQQAIMPENRLNSGGNAYDDKNNRLSFYGRQKSQAQSSNLSPYNFVSEEYYGNEDYTNKNSRVKMQRVQRLYLKQNETANKTSGCLFNSKTMSSREQTVMESQTRLKNLQFEASSYKKAWQQWAALEQKYQKEIHDLQVELKAAKIQSLQLADQLKSQKSVPQNQFALQRTLKQHNNQLSAQIMGLKKQLIKYESEFNQSLIASTQKYERATAQLERMFIEKQTKQAAEMKVQIEKYHQSLQSLEQRLNEEKNKNISLMYEKIQIEKRVGLQNCQQIQRMKADLITVQGLNHSLKTQLEQKSVKLKQCQQEMKRLYLAERQKGQILKKVQNLASQVQIKNQAAKSLQSQNTKMRQMKQSELNEVKNKLHNTEVFLNESRKEALSKGHQLNNFIKASELKQAKLSNQIRGARQQIQRLKSEVKELRNELNRVKNQQQIKMGEIASKRSQFVQMGKVQASSEVEKLKQSLIAQVGKSKQLSEAFAAKDNQINQIKRLLSFKQQQLQTNSQKSVEKDQKILVLLDRIRHLESNNQSSELSTERLRNEVKQSKREVDNFRSALLSTQAQLQKTRRQLTGQQNSLNQAQQANMKMLIQEMSKQIQFLQLQFSEMGKKHQTEVSQLNSQFQAYHQKAEAQIKEQIRLLESIQGERDKYKKQAHVMNQNTNSLSTEIEALKSHIGTLERQSQAWQQERDSQDSYQRVLSRVNQFNSLQQLEIENLNCRIQEATIVLNRQRNKFQDLFRQSQKQQQRFEQLVACTSEIKQEFIQFVGSLQSQNGQLCQQILRSGARVQIDVTACLTSNARRLACLSKNWNKINVLGRGGSISGVEWLEMHKQMQQQSSQIEELKEKLADTEEKSKKQCEISEAVNEQLLKSRLRQLSQKYRHC